MCIEILKTGENPLEIIETYWNVNYFDKSSDIKLSSEIIETYWNVNADSALLIKRILLEIIETYWNVNFTTVYNVNVPKTK